MDASKVEIHTGGVDRGYRTLGWIEAKRSKRSVFSADPTLDEVNAELRQKAAERDANAVIDVEYSRGMSLTSYGVLTARGMAVFLEADERDCPFCAEKVKRAAKVCKHCGRDLPVAQAA